jgi:S-adenosylmethionine hydrolase
MYSYNEYDIFLACSLICYTENHPQVDKPTQKNNWPVEFPESIHGRQVYTPNSAKPTLGVWGRAPNEKKYYPQVDKPTQKNNWPVGFPESIHGRQVYTPNSAKPTLGVWGRAPKKKYTSSSGITRRHLLS